VFYLFVLGWFFLGIAISSDIFMAGIEKITSRKTRVPHPLDKTRKVTVAVWNYTVANLTLMAFGSSTPEILLSIIELVSKNMFTGELGASTIVGSASFNLFIIIGVCISVIPPTEVRMIADLVVYVITAFFSIFAYFWLYYVLVVESPDAVTIWEGSITLFMFPLLIVLGFMADKGYFSKR
jgi:solute carrier family 8 (sodium/calcium exchanger)